MPKPSHSIYHQFFHRNMLALMTFNATTKSLKTCFKEGMFLRPNQEGFVQVSHFLMNIIYPGTQAFKRCWPILDRAQERAFRAALIDLIRGLNNDFGDIYPVSYVVPARLMSPGGDRYMKIMWELSILALGVQAKRESGVSDCFFFQKPPVTMPQHIRSQVKQICEDQTHENQKRCEAKLAELEERLKNYAESKGRTFDRMFARDKKLREIESLVAETFKEHDLGDGLISRLMDLKNEGGLLVLEEEVKKKSMSVNGLLQHWQNILTLTRDTKAILDGAVKQECESHKIILDISCINDCDSILESTKSARNVKANDFDISLLEYICGLYDRIKVLKLVLDMRHMNGCSNKWKSICEVKEIVDSDLRNLESKLEKELLGLSSHNEKNSPEGVSENDSHSSTSLIVSTAASTSTPIKNIISISSDAGLHTTVNITPHQPASSHDFFTAKLEEALKEIADEKAKRSQQNAAILQLHDSSIDELLDRFRKIVEIRGQRCDQILK